MRLRSLALFLAIASFCLLQCSSAYADSGEVTFCALGCISGTTSFTLTGGSLSIGEFVVSPGIDGPGTSDEFFGGSITLFGDGSATGSASGEFDVFTSNPFGPFDSEIVFSSWGLTGTPGNFTLNIFGEGFCENACALGTIPPVDIGPWFLTITAASITIPTPEPSSLLLLGTGLLGLGAFFRRRFSLS